MPTFQRTSTIQAVQMTIDFTLDTSQGAISGKAGDYVVDEDGHQLIYPKEVFERKYIETEESKKQKKYTYAEMAKGYMAMGDINLGIANVSDGVEKKRSTSIVSDVVNC